LIVAPGVWGRGENRTPCVVKIEMGHKVERSRSMLLRKAKAGKVGGYMGRGRKKRVGGVLVGVKRTLTKGKKKFGPRKPDKTKKKPNREGQWDQGKFKTTNNLS